MLAVIGALGGMLLSTWILQGKCGIEALEWYLTFCILLRAIKALRLTNPPTWMTVETEDTPHWTLDTTWSF